MFGAGPQKLIVLLAILVVVWYGFRYIGRIAAERRALERAAGGRTRMRQRARRPVEDMVRCARCGDYVPATGVGSCDRADCPSR